MTNKYKYFVANWKMFGNIKTINSVNKVIKIGKLRKFKKAKIIYCPPYTLINDFVKKLKKTKISVGAQNCHQSKSFGPFTGFINSKMLKNLGCKYVIIGHSENRSMGESDYVINKKIKSAELTKSMDIINKYINTSDVLNTLDNLGMKNSINRTFTQNTAAEIVQQEIRDNLDKEILREARKLLQEIDKNELSDLTKEASNIASEVASDPSLKESFSILDKKFGNFTLKQIIHASRNR